jgi:uncharacterized membrane protein
LRSSLWFVPTLVVLGSMALAHVVSQAGTYYPALSQEELPIIFGFGAEGSRSMLSAIATAMITIAGVAFSITIVVLSLTSSQYSPRVLRQFMRDRANQWVLGVFVGVFAYSLVVLPRIRGGDNGGFVPALAVAGGVVYALIGVGCLIFFIHHVATAIQASRIVSEIAAETRASADQLFAEALDAGEEDQESGDGRSAGPWHSIPSPASGYIQLVEEDDLLQVAAKHEVVVRMEHRVGEFVVVGTPIVSVSGRIADERALTRKLQAVFAISRTRTIEQDVAFGIRQIVDVALRALSPSLNDPTTATLCINYLTTILHPLATRRMGDRHRLHQGTVRMIGCYPDFETLLELAYGEIRGSAEKQVVVLRSLLDGLETLAAVTGKQSRRAALAAEAGAIRDLLHGRQTGPLAADVSAQAVRLVERLKGVQQDLAGRRENRDNCLP